MKVHASSLELGVAWQLKWKDWKIRDTICVDLALHADLALKGVSGSKVILVYFRKFS